MEADSSMSGSELYDSILIKMIETFSFNNSNKDYTNTIVTERILILVKIKNINYKIPF